MKPPPRNNIGASAASAASPWAPWLTQAAFVMTLILVIARAMMMETVREAFDVAARAGTSGPAGPGATTTLVMDALCCLPALLVLARRAIDEEYVVRWAWSHALLFAFAAWAAVSVVWSTDRFVTAIAAANLVAAATLVWSTAQLVRSWLRLHIVAGVCFGLLLAFIAHGLIYRFVDYPDNVAFWKEHKEQFFQEHGWEPDSFEAKQFERKLLNGEVVGFNQSANSFAAIIVMLMVVSAGIAIQRAAGGDGLGFPLFVALACLPALLVLYFTGSRTAAGTLIIAGFTFSLLAIGNLRAWLGRRPGLAYGIIAAMVLLGTVLLVAHGVQHGSLPQDSLNFRWRYWVASARLLRQHPMAGVGWGNFGPHYLSVRVPAAAEEIKDPHNFIVRAFAELGVVGGLLVLAWLARAAWELTRPVLPRAPSPTTPPSSAAGFATIAVIALGGVLLNVACAIDFSQPSSFVLLEVFRRLLSLGLLLVGIIVTTIRSARQQEMDDRPAPWIVYGLLIGLGVFFIHNLMDFVLAEAGAMTLFAVLLGAASGVRMPSSQGALKRRGLAISALACGGLAWVIAVVLLVLPVADAESRARAGDEQLGAHPELALASFRNAQRDVPYNADYAYRAARAALAAGLDPHQVRATLEAAIAADPANIIYYRTRADLEMRQPSPDEHAVRADFEKILALDPRNLTARLDYAKVLEKLDPAASAQQYRKALETSNGYDATEPRRLPAEEVKRINETIARLEASATKPGA